MPTLDVFAQDAFKTASLTASVNLLPFVPGRLGSMGLFRTAPITTTVVIVEEQRGFLSLLPTSPRGTMPRYQQRKDRRARSFIVPHIPFNDAVLADDVQNVRAFGTETDTQLVSQVVNDKLMVMRQSHEVTHEYHRIGAIQGEVRDADGASVIYNWFTEFGITEQEVEFDFADTGTYDQAAPADNMKLKCMEVERAVQTALGATPYTDIVAYCGDSFFDAFISHATVRKAWEASNANEFARAGLGGTDRTTSRFRFGNIWWENYRGAIGDVSFIATDVARFVPMGVPDFLIQHYAPANFMETVNTRGQAVYAKQERMDFDTGVELHTQSNPLMMCTRPRALVKGTSANIPGS